jgi:hypothetical protein
LSIEKLPANSKLSNIYKSVFKSHLAVSAVNMAF